MNIRDALYQWDRDHPNVHMIRLTTQQAHELHDLSWASLHESVRPVFHPTPGDQVISRPIHYVESEQNSDLYRYLKESTVDTNTDPWKDQVGGSHYKNMAIQPSEYITRNGFSWFAGNVIKYISRYRHKGNPLQDLRKARHYLDLLITETEREEDERAARTTKETGA